MKIRVEHNGTVFEYRIEPMPESRFRMLCLLAAAALYVKALVRVAATCGTKGVAAIVILTVIISIILAYKKSFD